VSERLGWPMTKGLLLEARPDGLTPGAQFEMASMGFGESDWHVWIVSRFHVKACLHSAKQRGVSLKQQVAIEADGERRDQHGFR
jgi:hypothetical protein